MKEETKAAGADEWLMPLNQWLARLDEVREGIQWALKRGDHLVPRKERDWRTMCIVELAVENPSVRDYVEHWEGRAIKAESSEGELREALNRMLAHFVGPTDDADCPECGGRTSNCDTCYVIEKAEAASARARGK